MFFQHFGGCSKKLLGGTHEHLLVEFLGRFHGGVAKGQISEGFFEGVLEGLPRKSRGISDKLSEGIPEDILTRGILRTS